MQNETKFHIQNLRNFFFTPFFFDVLAERRKHSLLLLAQSLAIIFEVFPKQHVTESSFMLHSFYVVVLFVACFMELVDSILYYTLFSDWNSF